MRDIQVHVEQNFGWHGLGLYIAERKFDDTTSQFVRNAVGS